MKEYEYDVSVFCSAVRPYFWEKIYESYKRNKSSFEVIFVGPNEPSFKLPSNFKFIYSEVKPSQCWEIAARACKGKYLLCGWDDCIHEKRYFDNMTKFYKNQEKKFSTDKIIIGGLHHFGLNKPRRVCRLWPKNLQPKQELPMDFFISRKLWDKIGGIDRNFVSLVWHWDIHMRVMEIGGKCVLAKYKFFELGGDDKFWKNKSAKKYVELSSITGKKDKKYFHELWFSRWGDQYSNLDELKKSGIPYYTRNRRGFIPKLRRKVVELFDDKDILTISQGVLAGKWEI